MARGLLIACLSNASCFDTDKLAERITTSVDQNVGNISTMISNAAGALENQSATWQTTIQNLEGNLTEQIKGIEANFAKHSGELVDQTKNAAGGVEHQVARDALALEKQLLTDVRGVVTQVSGVAKDGIQFGQESFNCQTDIFGAHARIALLNILNGFLDRLKYRGTSDRGSVPYVPIVCSANPSGISVGSWDNAVFLVLSGTDLNQLDSRKPDIVIVRADGTEFNAPGEIGARTTNYRYQVNVPLMISQRMLVNAVKMDIRWNGQHVNKNEIPIAACGARGQACCHGACEAATDSCINDICQPCGSLNAPCCQGEACTAGVCSEKFCVACGQPNQPCCAGSSCATGICRQGICAECGQLGQSCCNGSVCAAGECRSGFCAQCGQLGQPCCGGACSAGICSGGSCVACGTAEQPCCAGATCSTGTYCRNNTCKTCALAEPCGQCGGVKRCDGSCSKDTPSDFGVTREYSKDFESFACCYIDYRKTFGGDCHPGWVFHGPAAVEKKSGGGTCEVVVQGDGTNCRAEARFHNNGLEGAECWIKIRERRGCD